jgi:hypothetical protein
MPAIWALALLSHCGLENRKRRPSEASMLGITMRGKSAQTFESVEVADDKEQFSILSRGLFAFD